MWEHRALDAAGRAWPRAELRVGDADRQRAVAELQRHFVDGRLTSEELGERVHQALEARTFGELALPLADLPVLAGHADYREQPIAPATNADDGWHFSGDHFVPLVLLALVVVAFLWLAVISGGRMAFMFWPLLIWGFFSIGGPGSRGGRFSGPRSGRR